MCFYCYEIVGTLVFDDFINHFFIASFKQFITNFHTLRSDSISPTDMNNSTESSCKSFIDFNGNIKIIIDRLTNFRTTILNIFLCHHMNISPFLFFSFDNYIISKFFNKINRLLNRKQPVLKGYLFVITRATL